MSMPRSFSSEGAAAALSSQQTDSDLPIRPGRWAREGALEGGENGPRLDPRVAFVRDLIESGYQKPILVSKLADEVGLSARRLRMLFKHDMGMNVKEFILEVRLQSAQRLLAEGFLRVSEIGYKVGFESAANFSRAFKHRFGRSPSDTRRGPRPETFSARTGRPEKRQGLLSLQPPC